MNLPETVPQWLRRLMLDWSLDSSRLAELAHLDPAALESALQSESNADPGEPAPTIPPGLENAMPLIAIYRRLSSLLPDPQDQLQWLTEPHDAFDRNRPLDVMRSSLQNLYWVSYYLDSAPSR